MSFLLVLMAAILLLAAQSPDGDGVLAFAGVSAWRSTLATSVGLGLVALLIAASPGRALRRHGGGLLLGLLVGGTLQALLLGLRLPLPTGHAALAALLAILASVTLALLILRRSDEPADAVNAIGWLGLLLASAGAALCFQGLGRITLRLGLGAPQEVDWLAAVVLIIAALGGLAFGRFLAGFDRDRARGGTAGLALAGVGLGAWLSGRAALLVVSPRGLRTLVRRFGLDLSDSGTLLFNGLLGTTLCIAPAFFLGTALYAARGRRTLATIALGAAAGPLIGIAILEAQGIADLLQNGRGSAGLIHIGAWIGAGAALLLLLPGSGLRAGGRFWALATALPTLAALHFGALPSIPVLRAWSRFPADPIAVLETAAGQVIIEPDKAGGMQASLNQRPISGGAALVASESMQIQAAASQVDEQVRARGMRVLLIGQLDPWRAKFLLENGAGHIDRSAGWWPAMVTIEKYLGVDRRISGDVLSLTDAQAAWDAGKYDLVLALARPGVAPRIQTPATDDDTVVVLWVDGTAPLAELDFPDGILANASGLQEFAIAVTNTPLADNPSALLSGPALAPEQPWQMLARREWERPNPNRNRVLKRLSLANPTFATWLEALAELCAAQGLASPFETYAQSLVLDPSLIAQMCQAAADLGAHPLVRRVMIGLADVLVQRRAIGLLQEFFPPLSQAWNKPGELQLALAQGHLEALEPELVPILLRPFLTSTTIVPKACALLAEAHYQLGEYPESARLWMRLEQVRPLDPKQTTRLALSQLRSGDPRGVKKVEELLAADPENQELQAAIEAGPGPPPSPTFSPESSLHDH